MGIPVRAPVPSPEAQRDPAERAALESVEQSMQSSNKLYQGIVDASRGF